MRLNFQYKLATPLAKALDQSTRTLAQVAFPVGLYPCQISRLIHGATVGHNVAQRVIKVGESFGLSAEESVKQIRHEDGRVVRK
jgi:hypothetical protein